AFGILILGISILKPEKEEIRIRNFDKGTFIKITDSVSKPHKQISWTEVAAALAVPKKGDLSQVSEEDIRNMALKFIKQEGNDYVLESFDNVLEELNYNDKSKSLAKKFLSQIEKTSSVNGEEHITFINDIKEDAIKTYEKYGILPSITIAQAILETGWGKSNLTTKANNYFGIKADKGWKGKKVTMDTTEFHNKEIKDEFRYYEEKTDSFIDHGSFLKNNERYTKAGLFTSGNYIDQAKALEKAGYSTVEDKNGNKTYSKLLSDIIIDNNLMLIDTEAQR
ncbi:glucosaminidase domain-containing protein, partial [Clostridium sp.]|uniref:glucosaminidase domain-containing protein n=1 Tax=Clostridium sp. TaxID=1506 RepID=UPI003464C1A1